MEAPPEHIVFFIICFHVCFCAYCCVNGVSRTGGMAKQLWPIPEMGQRSHPEDWIRLCWPAGRTSKSAVNRVQQSTRVMYHMAGFYKINDDQKAPCVSVCMCPHIILESWENRKDTK